MVKTEVRRKRSFIWSDPKYETVFDKYIFIHYPCKGEIKAQKDKSYLCECGHRWKNRDLLLSDPMLETKEPDIMIEAHKKASNGTFNHDHYKCEIINGENIYQLKSKEEIAKIDKLEKEEFDEHKWEEFDAKFNYGYIILWDEYDHHDNVFGGNLKEVLEKKTLFLNDEDINPESIKTYIKCNLEEEKEREESICKLIDEALKIDGSHHKQYYFEEIAKILNYDLSKKDFEKGIIP